MHWQEIYDLGIILAEVSTAAAALWLREVRAYNGSAPRGFKLTLRGGPSKIMAEVERVAIEVIGVGRFGGFVESDIQRSFRIAVSQLQQRLDGGQVCPRYASPDYFPCPAVAVEALMQELAELAVGFCGQPTRPEEEPRFSLEIEDFSGAATVRLEFEGAKVECQTSGHYRRAVFESSNGTALDGIADVLAQAQAHLEAVERSRVAQQLTPRWRW